MLRIRRDDTVPQEAIQKSISDIGKQKYYEGSMCYSRLEDTATITDMHGHVTTFFGTLAR